MAVALSDVITKLKGYARNENLTDARAITVIDSAAAFVLNHIGAPGSEKEYLFDFDQDQLSYSLPVDFAEPISIRYAEERLNRAGDFKWRPPELLFKKMDLVSSSTRLFSHYHAGSSPVAFVLSRNSTAHLVLDTFDTNNAINWVPSNDAENLGDDQNVKKEGVASLKFDVDVTLSGNNRATLLRTGLNLDLSPHVNKGIFKCWMYLPDVTGLDTISFRWGNSASDYFLQTVSTQEDGTAFAIGWNKLAFAWNGSTTVNSPNASAISRLQFDLDYQPTYAGGANYRVDFLRVVVPDPMILTYYSGYKGKNISGTPLFKFSAPDDRFLFSDSDTMIVELIALQAAVILNPQLLVDSDNARVSYKEFHGLLSKRYPRKRVMGLSADPRISLTSWD